MSGRAPKRNRSGLPYSSAIRRARSATVSGTPEQMLIAPSAEDEATAKAGVGAPDLIPLGCHDPERVLAECAAKRAIVDDLSRFLANADAAGARSDHPTLMAGIELQLRYFAAVYVDHPDYDPAWKVEP